MTTQVTQVSNLQPFEKLELAILLLHWQWLNTCYQEEDERERTVDEPPTIRSSVESVRWDQSNYGYGMSEATIETAKQLQLSAEGAIALVKQLLNEVA